MVGNEANVPAAGPKRFYSLHRFIDKVQYFSFASTAVTSVTSGSGLEPTTHLLDTYYECPRCGSPVVRAKQNGMERFLAAAFSQAMNRYRCGEAQCSWDGLFPRPNSEHIKPLFQYLTDAKLCRNQAAIPVTHSLPASKV
jgi:predicted RNA-binding Zn-ribbon protein involved in translation (DUF1610 family)